MDDGPAYSTGEPPLIVGIALPRELRARLAELLDGCGTVVLVSTAAEARPLLDAAERVRQGRTEAGAPSGAPGEENSGSSSDLPVRRPAAPIDELAVVELAGTTIDSDLLVAAVGERQVALTPLEHDLLICLGAEPRHTWTHAALHEDVWNSRHAGGTADLHSVVKRLRRKLATLGAPTSIDAVRGVGFRLSEVPSHRAVVRQARRVDSVASGRRRR